jgi:hypothetical protein
MTIDLIYFNDNIRCYRHGIVERRFKRLGWREIQNTNNYYGSNLIRINNINFFRKDLNDFCFYSGTVPSS